MIRGQMVVRRGSAGDTIILLIYRFVLKFPSLNLGLRAALSVQSYQILLTTSIARTSLRNKYGVEDENTVGLF